MTHLSPAQVLLSLQADRIASQSEAELAEPIKEMIEVEPSFGYRTVAALLGTNNNTVQRIFQLKSLQVRKHALGQRTRIEARVSRAERPDQGVASRAYGFRFACRCRFLSVDNRDGGFSC